jgi:hypothetical protein
VIIVVMLLFMALSAGMFALSQMNVSHVIFFERRNVLEQATLSLAQALADHVVERSNVWRNLAPDAIGNGILNLDSGIEANIPEMKFTYSVSPDKFNSYLLFVRGEYANSSEDVIWEVSLDIHPKASKELLVRWSKPVQLSE